MPARPTKHQRRSIAPAPGTKKGGPWRVSSSPAVEEGTGIHAEAAPADRRGTGGAGKQPERRITHDFRSRSHENQSRAEKAMGEDQDSQAEAHDVSDGEEEDCGGAASSLGKGEEGGVKERVRPGGDTRRPLPSLSLGLFYSLFRIKLLPRHFIYGTISKMTPSPVVPTLLTR
jgi:hypothetical protein